MKVYLTPKTLKKIIKMLILFILACILIYYSNTLEVKAYTVSTDSIYICNSSDNAISNDYYYVIDGENYIGNFGTTYQGFMSAFSTRFNAQIDQGNSYTLELNSNTGDFRNITAGSIQILGGIGTHCSDNLNAYTITSVTSTYYKITIDFVANSTNNYTQLSIFNEDGSGITGITNFKIDSMTLVDNGNKGTNTIIDNQNQNKQDIIDNQNTNTNTIIDNQNQTTQDIIDNQNENNQNIIENDKQNTQDIIDNQNKNNEEIKDTMTDIFTNDCHPSNNLLPYLNGTWSSRGITLTAKEGIYNFSGTFTGSAGGVTVDIPDFTLQAGTYTINLNRKGTAIYPYFTLQGDTNIGIRDGKYITFTLDSATTFNSIYFYFNSTSYNSQYSIMLSIGGTPQDFEKYGEEVCNNKLDDLNQNQQATNDKLDNLQDSIIDSTAPDTSNLENAAGWLPPGPVDSLVNLPINLLNSLLGNIGTTCTNINLTLPFVNKNFSIPCPNELLNNLGATFLTFWEGIGLIAGCWCLYKYFIALYKWVESALTLDEKDQLGKWGGV